jgi:hypothetical protein
VAIGLQRQEVMDERQHVLARHRGKRLIRPMGLMPLEQAAGSQETPLARPGLQPAHLAQVLRVRGQ